MTHGSLFSGIGGFDLAAEWMGWDNVFHCEWNPFGQKVLKHHFPNSISYNDITKTDFTIHRGTIDILTGGFPCQPYSLAGKRKGKEDERHLWPSMLRAIREIQPRFVVGENVFGLINWSNGMVFDEVQTDLEAEGYEVFPYVLPACAVNAPHRRDRVWFVAHLCKQRCDNGGDNREERHFQATGGWKSRFSENGSISTWNDTDTYRNGRNGKDEKQPSEGGFDALGNVEQMGEFNDSDSYNSRFETQYNQKPLMGEESAKKIFSRNSIGSIYSRTRWKNFPSQSPICGGDDGLPTELDNITFSKWRNESIKAFGNAIVPQVALQIFKALQEYENTILRD